MTGKLLKNKCRTCLTATKGLKSLTTKSNNDRCYAELLAEITNINIMDHKYRELPQFICGYCSKRLKAAHAFVEQAKGVNEELLSILNEKDELKHDLDCLQEAQIDIQSCLKTTDESDDDESRNDKLECMFKLGTNADVLNGEIVTDNKEQLLKTTLKCRKQGETEGDGKDLGNIENNNYTDLEDILSPSNHAELDDTREKSDSELDSADYYNETLAKSDAEDQREHEKDVKENQNGNDVAVPCNKCNKIFVNSKALRVHQRISHVPEERKCTCNLCGSKFTRYCNMYKHMRTFHGPDSVTLMRKPAEGDNLYECDKCPKKYSRKKSLSFHIKTKHLTLAEVDNSQTNSSKSKTKPIDRGSLCPICGSSFTSKTQLTVHIRRHTGERPFKCDLCDRAFLLVTQLNSHKRVHTGEKPYKCQLCSKAFRVSDHLRQHMRSHTDDRPYKCSQCERSFKYSQDLSKHLRSNRSVRPYGRICDNTLPRCNKTLKTNHLKMNTIKNVMHQNV